MHEESPAVIHLAIHIPNEQPIYFEANINEEALWERMLLAKSTLIAFFEYNQLHEDGQQYLYQDFPPHFTYNPQLWK
ncbi:uncharacterized protein H6S33_003223 [Morchella sextelata]|uniref:uncharacterized protein n=1 Tax=Morchella sextelata TaxID=1174677 RepID=UPI001D03C49D|nr:uncharacterized protein H6S33_003223 [Morchella sextelata]KAH0607235.1 hypothetical protein H6S33_003223 [Morchella sextelata]